MLLRNRHGQTAVLVRRSRTWDYIVPMQSGRLALRRIAHAKLETEWAFVADYGCGQALERFLATGEQHGMTEAAAEALRGALAGVKEGLPL